MVSFMCQLLRYRCFNRVVRYAPGECVLPKNTNLYNWLMPGINIINIEEEDEPLKGRPRTVRLQKTDYQLGRSVALLAIVTDHDSNGNVTERRVYRPDGTLSFHESSQYEADPPGCTVRILNAQGEIVSTRRI